MKLRKVDAPIAKLRCPHCSESLSAVAHPDMEAVPRPGDLSICVYCACPLRFTETLGIERLTEEDVKKLPASTQAELNAVRSLFKGPTTPMN